MRSLILSIVILFSIPLRAEVHCYPKISREEFEKLVQVVKEDYFPKLENIPISVATFSSNAYFLQAQPVIKTLVKKRQSRQYKVQLNTKLLDCPPSQKALEAILVHELEHILDYTNWSSKRIAAHGVRYTLSSEMRASYERATDQKVLFKGLHQGLIEYREWVYQWLTPKELSAKKRIYLTPEEILDDLHHH